MDATRVNYIPADVPYGYGDPTLGEAVGNILGGAGTMIAGGATVGAMLLGGAAFGGITHWGGIGAKKLAKGAKPAWQSAVRLSRNLAGTAMEWGASALDNLGASGLEKGVAQVGKATLRASAKPVAAAGSVALPATRVAGKLVRTMAEHPGATGAAAAAGILLYTGWEASRREASARERFAAIGSNGAVIQGAGMRGRGF